MNNSANIQPPLVAHIIHRLDYGGLENGLINLINSISAQKYRHVIICLAGYSAFSDRINNKEVRIFSIDKKPGQDIGAHWRMWRLLRQLKPAIVHTRNLGTLEFAVVAMLAGVPVRIHGEHGRDMSDVAGENRKYQLFRRGMSIFLHMFIALSKDLAMWLQKPVGIGESMICQIYNGVDTEKFSPNTFTQKQNPWPAFSTQTHFVIGTVGRMQAEKDQATLVKAFIALVKRRPDLKDKLRLVLVGDGPLRSEILGLLEDAGVLSLVWAPGNRSDVENILPNLNLFVLPSLIEGISNTILEAMACGVAVLATAVGGNTELVVEGETGNLVASRNAQAMSEAMERYANDPAVTKLHGQNGRMRVESFFSLRTMVNQYCNLYDDLCMKQGVRTVVRN